MKKIRAAVIGVGYLGKFHAEKYSKIENVEFVGVVDSNKENADLIAKNLGTQSFYDLNGIMDKIDVASIVVPTPLHFDISKKCLENDIDILLEKPMTTTLEQADELIKLAEEKGRLIQVGHLERYNPAVIALKNMDVIPKYIESNRLSVYQKRGTDVSVVLDLMIHDIDIILNFVKSGVKHIHATGIPVISRHVDIANARLEFDNGCVANITASRIADKASRKIKLFQEEGYICVDFANREIDIARHDKNVSDGNLPGMNIEKLSIAQSDALEDEIRAFIISVSKRKTPEVSGEVSRDALKIALSVMDQINANRI